MLLEPPLNFHPLIQALECSWLV